MDDAPEGGGGVGTNQTGRSSSAVTMKNDEPLTEGQQGFSTYCTQPEMPSPVSPVPSCVSMKSDWSIKEPPTFSSGPPQSDSNMFRNILNNSQSRCGVCEQLQSSPVIITCGHSFCSQCISSYCSQSGPSGVYSCPQCRQRCRIQTVINPDTTMAQPLLHSHGPIAQTLPYTSIVQPNVYPSAYIAPPNLYLSQAAVQSTVNPSATMVQPTVNPNAIIMQPSAHISASMGQHALYHSATMPQHTANPSATMQNPYLYHHNKLLELHLARPPSLPHVSPYQHTYLKQHPLYSEMGQDCLNPHMPMAQSSPQPPDVIAQYPPYSNSEMRQDPLHPHKRAAQPSPQPPLVQHTAASNHVQTNQATAKRARLAGNCDLNSVLMSHKAKMKKRFESISEGIIRQGAQTLLNKIYTELYITEGESEDVNNEHEVWQVEAASRPQTTDDTAINCNDIFNPVPGQEGHIRSVMTKGIAGIGKTVSVQKFILDWAEDNANQDMDFMFVLPFRELNLVKDAQYSLHRLLLDFHPELSELDNSEYKDCNIIFIFDGLDESRLQLDFQKNEKVSDVTQLSPVNVLMTSLIQGALLPSARIWITSRPAAANQVPSQCVDLVTEVRGFSDPQKEEYFRKRINDHSLADRLITHIKASRSLFIMCHMPVFCWIAATVLQQILEEENGSEAPKTLTEMFIHFLLIQTTRKHQKYQEETEADRQRLLESHKSVILKLAELAFTHLENGNLMFYEDDLRKCGIDVSEASVYSGMCTEIFREECVFEHQKVYCFVHLSIQEFLAALHVFSSYINKNVEVLGQFVKRNKRITALPLHELLKSAVNKALESKNGHLDLFVRFLHGISLTSNHGLMLGLLTHTHSSSKSVAKTIKNLKVMQRQNISPERCINLFHCLVEMHDSSVHDEIQAYLKAEKGSVKQLSLAHCSALAYMLLMSDEVLDEFDLKKYKTTDEGRRRLVPVVRCCRKAILGGCQLSDESYKALASALQSCVSLTELDLADNNMSVHGVQLLYTALHHNNCKLQTLRLSGCQLTDKSCEVVANALQSANTLLEMDLSNNALGDSGVEFICKGLSSPHCKLQTLRLGGCQLSDESYRALASALQSCASLTELDLADNSMSVHGVQLLYAALHHNNCKLQTLRLTGCQLTDKSCEVVANALQSANPLLEMDLSNNALGDSGVEFICKGLSSPHCKLQTLRLVGCQLSDESYKALSSALQSYVSLTELDLAENNMSVHGVQLLYTALHHTNCKLQTLRISPNYISGDGCVWLAFTLMSNPSAATRLDLDNSLPTNSAQELLLASWRSPANGVKSLQLPGCKLTDKSCEVVAKTLQSANPLLELDLSKNALGDSGARTLSNGLSSPHCKLQILRLAHCNLTENACKVAASALQSLVSLTELDLSGGDLKDSGVQLLSPGLHTPQCKLRVLRLSGCQLTDKSCEVVANALQSANTLLEMDLSNNALGDSGVEFICEGLSSPHCKLQTLRLNRCDLSKASYDVMASVLQRPSSRLRELDMSDNDLQDGGVELLCVGLKHPQCKLETLRLSVCQISSKGCSFLASALKSNPSYLKELDLTYNHPGNSGVRELSDRLNEPNCKLETLRFDHGGECRMKPGPRKYACELTLDPNTAHSRLSLSEGNRKVTWGEQQQYPDHPDRCDDWYQVLCREGLTGHCYWEAEWSGDGANISVAYRSIQRKGGGENLFGLNDRSWSLECSIYSYYVYHNNKSIKIPAPSPRSSRVGVYLDWPAGTLSFYSVSSDTLTHLHTFHSTFTQPLYPGFRVIYLGSSVSLCQIT
ncbi:NACHT, LRR and PYD domains-containing protein 12-like [Engraulis encrasicolus]|uniref:NACHT, LRR and PYD domains-containing protein 12-like n=1 Tax=Engraulis encrasicolus TaxID=184585 RepID=UPI002FD54CCD